jgi:hypothetical protein
MAYESWNNNDNPGPGFGHPEWPVLRVTREVVQLTTSNLTIAGATSIKFTYNGNVANIGVTTNQYVNLLIVNSNDTSANLSSNGSVGMFPSNNKVSSFTGNLVTLSAATTGNIAAGSTIAFDALIAYPAAKPVEVTYNSDTVLATPTRITTANNKIGGSVSVGWVHVQKKTNNDGTIRYIRETLVALANATSSNTFGGNTSWGQAFANT